MQGWSNNSASQKSQLPLAPSEFEHTNAACKNQPFAHFTVVEKHSGLLQRCAVTSSLLAARWNSCILFHTIGTFIRRHHIPLPPPDEDQFYTVYHFNINIDIVFYGWKFKIYDCDTFTKIVLKNMGVKLNAPGQCPEDPYLKMRREVRSWYICKSLSSEWESLRRVSAPDADVKELLGP